MKKRIDAAALGRAIYSYVHRVGFFKNVRNLTATASNSATILDNSRSDGGLSPSSR